MATVTAAAVAAEGVVSARLAGSTTPREAATKERTAPSGMTSRIISNSPTIVEEEAVLAISRAEVEVEAGASRVTLVSLTTPFIHYRCSKFTLGQPHHQRIFLPFVT